MEYDPIKRRLGSFFYRNLFTLKIFYFILDLLFLRTWYVHRELKSFARQNKNSSIIHVLDAGSGFGQYSWYMARKFRRWNILGVDVKEEEIEQSQLFFKKAKLNNCSFEVKDLTSYISPDKFNLILSVDVMEHIEEDQKVFDNFYKSLKKNGLLIISTPSDQGGSDINHEGDESFISEHVRDGYSSVEIKEKLENSGFKDIKTKYSYGKAGSLAWRVSIKYPALLLNTSKWFFILLPLYYIIFYPICYLSNFIDVHSDNKKGTGLIVTAVK